MSSHGITYNNDASNLKLHAITHAKKVIHLTAAEEHRKTFSLTNIKSAQGVGEEYFLPGVHSDVGGSYTINEDATEKHVVFDGDIDKTIDDKKRLIESGWYKKSEITLDKIGDLYDADDEFFADGMLTVTRTNIDNKYCRIAVLR
ncbi:hypothetical protein MNBD_GAMMA07-2421 [hydrothermal vent metagenome]|uniref:Uncharacterized protein n=1 Tax=hydrothermal vent metagenome TaxID=652676 RepID=A0A3B0WM34_9ZZZZ